MSNLKIKHILLASLLLMLSLINVEVYAQDYGTLNSRVYQNNSIINAANKMDLVKRESFKDKYLTDLGELSYKGLSSNQYKEIQSFANNTILGGSNPISFNLLSLSSIIFLPSLIILVKCIKYT